MERIHFAQDWCGMDGVFGGYVIARLGAAAQQVGGMELLSLAVEFTGSVRPGAADLAATVRHRGRQSACVDLVLVQGHPKVSAVAKLARVRKPDLQGQTTLDLSGVATVEHLAVLVPPYGHLPYSQFVEMRRIQQRNRHDRSRTEAWIRLDLAAAPVNDLDAVGRTAAMIDAVPPGLFFADRAPLFVPTLDFSLHLRPRPPVTTDGWYHVVASTVWATGDFCMEDITLRTSSGAVVAQARQNRRIVWDSESDAAGSATETAIHYSKGEDP